MAQVELLAGMPSTRQVLNGACCYCNTSLNPDSRCPGCDTHFGPALERLLKREEKRDQS